ncbi:hypothetical protein LV779_33910 [Streptomyces thinghirensis]|nr:hypothetical protein [Streptomyces thinghirensis]
MPAVPGHPVGGHGPGPAPPRAAPPEAAAGTGQGRRLRTTPQHLDD